MVFSNGSNSKYCSELWKVTSTDVSTVRVLINVMTAANVSPFCKVAGSSAVMLSGVPVVKVWGSAKPRPSVG